MLIYSYKLEKYIRDKIFPKISLPGGKYSIKGSFRRKAPYVTDIDVVQYVFPEINKSNIYSEIKKLVEKVLQDKSVILVRLGCGMDERFVIRAHSEEEYESIKPLLDSSELAAFEHVMKIYERDHDKKVFYLDKLFRPNCKIKWTPEEVLANKKILRGGKEITFEEILQNNEMILIQYFIKIGSYPVGIDLVIQYEEFDMQKTYEEASKRQIKLSNYAKEYYFMLYPLRYYFKNNPDVSNELNHIIEKKFGLYKQLIVLIESYHTLNNVGKLDLELATNIIQIIIKSLKYLPDFRSRILRMLKQISETTPPENKIKEWSVLLSVLSDELSATINTSSEEYFFKFLNLIPEEERHKYFIQQQTGGWICRIPLECME